MSLNTKRPHAGVTPTGVSKEKYCGVAPVTVWIQSSVSVVSLIFVMLAAASCAGSQPRVNYVQVVNQGLQGVWLLKSYRPLTSLDVPLLALVNLQLGQMRVTVNGAQMTAQGPGVQVERTYQVLQADGMFATIVISAPTGEQIRVSVNIEGNLLTFRPLDAPWSGEGTLQRL